MPDFEVPAVLPVAGILPAPEVPVPTCPVPGLDLAFPVVPVPEPVPGEVVEVLGCVVEVLGWVADGAALGALPEPVDGALPVPVLPPLVCARAGATIAATSARTVRMLNIRVVMSRFSLELFRSLLLDKLLGRTREWP
jgi:hypothetical protein